MGEQFFGASPHVGPPTEEAELGHMGSPVQSSTRVDNQGSSEKRNVSWGRRVDAGVHVNGGRGRGWGVRAKLPRKAGGLLSLAGRLVIHTSNFDFALSTSQRPDLTFDNPPDTTIKMAPAPTGGKKQKKKWSKGKAATRNEEKADQPLTTRTVKDKAQHAVVLDKTTSDKLDKDVQSYRLITVATLVDRLKINGSLARKALSDLEEKGQIRKVVGHSKLSVYTRAVGQE
ncbi:S25 ribosomal protein-domain-containing protein [Phyllosticta citrichinensis]